MSYVDVFFLGVLLGFNRLFWLEVGEFLGFYLVFCFVVKELTRRLLIIFRWFWDSGFYCELDL